MQNSSELYLSGLNEQQRDAVLCRADIVFVEAGPGTGKTHLLTSKLVDFIESSSEPQKVVALSYTNTAAHQIGDRFRQKAAQSGITKDYSFFNGTIHSFCFRMMKSFHEERSKSFDYVILDDEEIHELSQDIQDSTGSNVPLSVITDCLHGNTRNADPKISKAVSLIKESYHIISISDILIIFIRTIDEDEGFRRWLSKQVTVMAVDEAQDLSALNYDILDRMLDIIPGMKLFLVGDPRQNIFEFNGGSYRNLDGFLSKHANHETKHLTMTYRCGQAIADYVNTFTFSDCDNMGLKSMCPIPGDISVRRAPSENVEAMQVLEAILATGDITSCAVLCNNLKYTESIISLLRKDNIPYKVFGGRKTLKKHIRFINHIIRIIDSNNAYSIRKVAQYAGIDIVRDGKKRKSAFFESDLGQIITSIREGMEGRPFPAVMDAVLSQIMRDPSDEEEVTEDFDRLQEIAGQYATAADYLLSFATDKEMFADFYLKDYQECSVPTDEGYLTISTIHSAKGLEWDNVFIIGLCEGNFPNPYFCKDLPEEEQVEFFNGEWKKMYVASTRARKSLCLTYPSSICRKGYNFHKAPSRFIGRQYI